MNLLTAAHRHVSGACARLRDDEDALAPAGEPRAGVIAPRLVMEMLPDEGKRRTGRAASLVRGGSGDLRPGADVDDPAAGKGYWVIEVDEEGVLFGDDGDGIRVGDNCPNDPNLRQRDLDGDGAGDKVMRMGMACRMSWICAPSPGTRGR